MMQARTTPITLTNANGDSKTYQLIFNFNALVAIEQALGKSIQQLFKAGNDTSSEAFVQTLFSVKNTLVFLTAGLQTEHPEVSEAELGDWLTISDYTNVVQIVASALFEALGGGLPEAAEGKKQTRGGAASKKSAHVLA